MPPASSPPDELLVTTPQQHVVVVGESLLDELRSAQSTVERVGGSCLNVTVGLSRLGTPVTFATSFGDDAAGRRIAERLAGVTLVRSVGLTARAIAQLDREGVAQYQFSFAWDLGDLVLEVPPTSHLHVGSLGAVCEPGAGRVLEIVRRHSGTVSYDPNWRASMAPAGARERAELLMSLATVVKLSEDDAAALFPGTSPVELARRLLQSGPEVVVLTRGRDGAEAWTVDSHEHVPTPAGTPVIDTVGAGDAFMAGFLHTWLQQRDVAGALTVGCWVARRTCEQAGADPPTARELSRAVLAQGS